MDQSAPRLPYLIFAVLALLLALWAGLVRMGWPWPVIHPTLPMAHGPLMIGGFLGTLISLERAIAVQRRWAYSAPLATSLGAALIALGITDGAGQLLITLGSILLLLTMIQILRIHVTLHTGVMIAGVGCWLVGNLFWGMGQAVPGVLAWWIGFPLLTVAGERLELGRFLQLPPRTTTAFLGCVALFLLGAIVATIEYTIGMRLVGVAMLLLALWLLRYDIASRRLKAGGQARFIAISLLSGYGWLAFGGVLLAGYGGLAAGPLYDALIHAIFLGFVFTMIFAHAPIIFPAVLQRTFHYTPLLYSHLVLLHITLLVRVAGDLLLWWPGRQWGGLLNAVVLLLFLGNTVASIRKRS
ncbi:MAG: hypothetical protein KF832_16555 [Caldilineaceae bacterium]|nr:hypothetical protein [Caldilineaceae bacterium]